MLLEIKRKLEPVLFSLFSLFSLVLFLALMQHGKALAQDRSEVTFEDLATLPKSGQNNAFFGHYNYVITLPAHYLALAKFTDSEKRAEVAWFFPRDTQPAFLRAEFDGPYQEPLYGRWGIIRLEVIPKNHPRWAMIPPELVFKAFQGAIPEELKRRGDTFTMKDMPAARRALQITITKPVPLVQVLVEGDAVIYMFTTGQETQELHEIIDHLVELKPHDPAS